MRAVAVLTAQPTSDELACLLASIRERFNVGVEYEDPAADCANGDVWIDRRRLSGAVLIWWMPRQA